MPDLQSISNGPNGEGPNLPLLVEEFGRIAFDSASSTADA